MDQIESYEEWLNMVTLNAHSETVSPDWVVTDTFFAIRKEDKKMVGIIDFRHTLNEFLLVKMRLQIFISLFYKAFLAAFGDCFFNNNRTYPQ